MYNTVFFARSLSVILFIYFSDCMLIQINNWMCQNWSRSFWCQWRTNESQGSASFSNVSKTTNQATNLGVVMDRHIKTITKSAYYHLKNTSRINGLMSQQDLEKLVRAFIFRWLDYRNGVFTGLPKKIIRQLQLIQNAAAWVLTKTKNVDHITLVLKSLHWLPVCQRLISK